MRVRGIGNLRRIVRGVTNRLIPQTLILLYHRVTELSSDPQLLCVSCEHFAEHLEILGKIGYPTRLKSLDQALQHSNRGRCGIIVTFDDGYADNLYHAKPLLERHEIPATVFVTTDLLGSQKEFWQDDLERLFLQPGVLPETLSLTIGGKTFDWVLGEASHYSEDAYQRHRLWNVSQKHDPTLRHGLYRFCVQILQPLPTDERRTVLNRLMKWADVRIAGRPTHRVLSHEEVVQLGDGGLIEIGSHTVTHPVLSALPLAAQKDELLRSKVHLEEIMGRPVTSFAYPYGRRSDYTEETVAVVRQVGFDYACSNFAGIVRSSTERWQLPRFLIRDWSGEEFAARLRAWLSD